MPTKANLQIHLNTVGDVILDQVVNCAENPTATGEVDVRYLDVGMVHTIEPPTVVGYTVLGVLIKPAAGNTGALILRGITDFSDPDNPIPGSTAVNLHKTNPSFIAMDQLGSLFIEPTVAGVVTFIWI